MNKRKRRTGAPVGRIFGLKPVMEALRGQRKIDQILIADGSGDQRLEELFELARQNGVHWRRASRSELDRLSDGANHQGVIAHASVLKYAQAEELLDLVASRVGSDAEPLVSILDGIEDPRNFGAILRTAECAGVDGVFIAERRAVGLTDIVAKASAGAIEYVPVARVTNLTRLIEQLKERNVWVVGTAGDAAKPYTEWDWTRATAVVLGSEGSGLHRLVRERCDALVRLPLLGRIESLNVSVAAGVLFYEALRQRSAKESRR